MRARSAIKEVYTRQIAARKAEPRLFNRERDIIILTILPGLSINKSTSFQQCSTRFLAFIRSALVRRDLNDAIHQSTYSYTLVKLHSSIAVVLHVGLVQSE